MADLSIENVQALDEDDQDLEELITLITKEDLRVSISKKNVSLSNLVNTVIQCGKLFFSFIILVKLIF
jgi:hypothetical protein